MATARLDFRAATLDIYANPGSDITWRVQVTDEGITVGTITCVAGGQTPTVDTSLSVEGMLIADITLTDTQTSTLGAGSHDWSFKNTVAGVTTTYLVGNFTINTAGNSSNGLQALVTATSGTATVQTLVSTGAATALAAHLSDAADAHDASAVSFTPVGHLASTTVQAVVAAIEPAVFSTLFAAGRTGVLQPLPVSHPDPPTVTLSAANGATLLDSPTHVNGTNSTLWRQLCATAARQANTYIHTTSLTTEGSLVQGANFQTNHVEFFFDGIEFEFKLIGFGGSYRLAVDDMWVHTDDSARSGPAATGSSYRLHVEFGSRAVRKIRLELATQPWDGVYLETGDSIWATPQPALRMIVIGDSFVRDDRLSGVAAQYEQRLTAFPFVLGNLLGIPDTWASGLGSTGYLATTAAPRVKFRDRLQDDVLDHSPDIIVWAGGHNDNAFTVGEIQAEAEACYEAALTALPNVRQFVCSPFNSSGTVDATRQGVSAAIEAAAAEYDLPFLDVLDPLIWSGTGKVGATAGDGNSDYYVCNDGIHPSGAGTAGGGHTYLGVRVANLMLPYLLT